MTSDNKDFRQQWIQTTMTSAKKDNRNVAHMLLTHLEQREHSNQASFFVVMILGVGVDETEERKGRNEGRKEGVVELLLFRSLIQETSWEEMKCMKVTKY